jgi:hypothetical protein
LDPTTYILEYLGDFALPDVRGIHTLQITRVKAACGFFTAWSNKLTRNAFISLHGATKSTCLSYENYFSDAEYAYRLILLHVPVYNAIIHF